MVGLAAVLLGGFAYAQAPAKAAPVVPTTVVLPPGPLLPQSFGIWQRVGDAVETRDVMASGFPDPGVLKEDGASRAASSTYQKNGGELMKVDAVEFGDASGAYSGFTLWSAKDGRSMVVRQDGEQAALAGQGLLFRSGTVLVLLHDIAQQVPNRNGNTVVMLHEAGVQKDAMQQLQTMLPKVGGPRGQVPMVTTLLPARGLVTGSVRYALGPLGYTAMNGALPVETLGFDKSVEVATAEYNSRSGKGQMTLLLCPTPQIAAERGKAIETAVNAVLGKYGKTVKLRRDGPLVAMAAGDFSVSDAQALVERANLHQEVSWNKELAMQNFNLQLHKTASLLENIVVLSCGLTLAALVLGVFFGFGRAGVRVLMGKPAALEPEFLHLDLSGMPPGVLLGKKDPES